MPPPSYQAATAMHAAILGHHRIAVASHKAHSRPAPSLVRNRLALTVTIGDGTGIVALSRNTGLRENIDWHYSVTL